MFEVKKAKRQRRPLKVNLEGVSGSGKTFTALRLAFAMRRAGIGKRVVVLDSENDSAGLYDGIQIDGEKWEYDVCPMPHEKQNPVGYAEAYDYLVGAGYDIIIGDSLTHAWYGAQEQVDRYAAANRNDKFGGWAKVTPLQRAMLATLTDARAHFIGTMRVKSEYAIDEKDNGKKSIKKIGTKTDQREGSEYEFDCVVRMDKGDVPSDHVITVEKVRGCTALDGKVGVNPGPEFWRPLFDWWLSAEAVPVADPVEDAKRALRGAKTLDELATVWKPLPAHVKERVAADKDRRKAELAPSARATTTPPPAGKPDPAADRAAALEQFNAAANDSEMSPAALVAYHAIEMGWTGPLPDLDALTAADLRRLAALVRTNLQGA